MLSRMWPDVCQCGSGVWPSWVRIGQHMSKLSQHRASVVPNSFWGWLRPRSRRPRPRSHVVSMLPDIGGDRQNLGRVRPMCLEFGHISLGSSSNTGLGMHLNSANSGLCSTSFLLGPVSLSTIVCFVLWGFARRSLCKARAIAGSKQRCGCRRRVEPPSSSRMFGNHTSGCAAQRLSIER